MAKEKTKYYGNQGPAIESTGNVVVSAGAGSGKTFVLTERVKNNILGLVKGNGKVKLSELLILTFTNEAAQSMKNKIKKALDEVPELRYLIPIVDSSHIETFDAYARFIVEKYGSFVGVSSGFDTLDQEILSVKSINILDEIFDKLYEDQDETFVEIIYNYTRRGDENFKEFIRSVYNNVLFQKNDPIAFLNEYKKEKLNKEFFNNVINDVNKYIAEQKEIINADKNKISFHELKEKIDTSIASLENVTTIDKLSEIEDFKEMKTLNDILKKIDDPFERQIESEVTDEIKDAYNSIFNLKAFDLDEFFNRDVEYQIKYLTFIIDRILIPLINGLEDFKKKTNCYTFSDIALFATKILKENDSVRNEIKNQFKLIMIDEYQDTSPTQDEFINLIENNNVFCVGDIKQSIYRFRGAEPSLFKKRYDDYNSNNGNGRVINMNNNFRSRKEILYKVNDMFSALMTNEFGGADYLKEHIIESANDKYDTIGKTSQKHGIFEIPYSGIAFSEGGSISSAKENRIEQYAVTIANNIKEKVNSKYLVLDDETLRPCSYKDFAILTYIGDDVCKVLERVFKRLNIPFNGRYSEDMKEDSSIIVLKNIFHLINLITSPKSDLNEDKIKHKFASILRSFLYSYSDEELYRIFKDNNYKEHEVYKKIEEFAFNNASKPLKTIFSNIMSEFDFIKNISKLKDAVNAIDKNNIFFDKTKLMDKIGFTLNDFCIYLDTISDFNIEMEQEIFSESTDSVTFMTIHKSKGLEFPIVYLPFLDGFIKPKNKGNGDFYVLDDEFFLPLFSDPKKVSNIFGILKEMERKKDNSDDAERLRLFYVALTRAKEDVILVSDNEPQMNRDEYNNKIKDKIEKYYIDNKISYTEEDLNKETIKEAEENIKTHSRFDFNDFLFLMFNKYETDPYVDEFIKSPTDYLNKIMDKYEIENSVNNFTSLKEEFFKVYVKNDRDLNRTSIDEVVHNFKNKEELKKNTGDKKTKSKNGEVTKDEVLFFGIISIDGHYLKGVVSKEGKADTKFVFSFFYEDDLVISFKDKNDIESFKNRVKSNDFQNIYNEYVGKFNNPNYDLNEKIKSIDEGEKINFNEIHIKKIPVKSFKKASKDADDEVNETTLDYGTHMHALLEIIDFDNSNLDIIKNNYERNKIEKVVNLINGLKSENTKIFKEYQFIDDVNNTSGIIDLLLVNDNKTIVIDYKLKNIDDPLYINQLKTYKDAMKNIFKKEVNETYLLSINDGILREVKCE